MYQDYDTMEMEANIQEEFIPTPFEDDGIPQIERATSSMVLSLMDLLKIEAGIRPFLTAWMHGSPTAVGLGVMCAYFASCLLRLTAATVWPVSLIASGIVVLLSVLTSSEPNYTAGAWGGRWLPLLNETRKAAINWLMGNRTQPLS
ncbi:hypothetical protein J437_LFUL003976 [Ladona fulva]|uniref:Uncharacterized protein n=1 Tax=Ladona fulva TaxID=123851 RepID=A0A8K0K2R1_LADFU|nr:hypothetical protein J437_LFUL003976 [Ladona fulva]